MQLNEEYGALEYLKKVWVISVFPECSPVANYNQAQLMVATNSENDPLVDSRIQELKASLQDLQRDDGTQA